MTSSDIRQSFLDFFRSKQHTIVSSASLLPDSPNLLFTNAGMNQFVPIFLGQRTAPYQPPRAADTQKCIRAGGKHNDLDDVGLDTYHHTFFEMLGNWSFGDYFKKEAIEWAWELVIETWKFPAERLYATVYSPDQTAGDPSEFDQEAHDHWARLFMKAGLDPAVHIVNGNKKDNFWMMGETGPCGPCSELHIDLTPAGDTRGSLVNAGDARCIEIWNLVFIQFNANPDGTFSPLPARHVDTGMGFERVASIIQGTKKFTDFTGTISNYETDIFRPIFDELEKMSDKRYASTLPGGQKETLLSAAGPISGAAESSYRMAEPADHSRGGILPHQSGDSTVRPEHPATRQNDSASRSEHSTVAAEPPCHAAGTSGDAAGPHDRAAGASDHSAEAVGQPPEDRQVAIDIAFRVIADHIRTLSFAIADGIQPGNTDRNYVLRRILRRAVRYGRTLGFHEPFFYKLVAVLARTMGDFFPEIRAKQKQIEEVLRREEEAFNKTLDKGITLFESEIARLRDPGSARDSRAGEGDSPSRTSSSPSARYSKRRLPHFERPWGKYAVTFSTVERRHLSDSERGIVLDCILFPAQRNLLELYAACVMPDHVHLLFEPQVKESDAGGEPVFYALSELLQNIKSVSAHKINANRGTTGAVWEKESFDRLIRSEADLQEKFLYICGNPWKDGMVENGHEYPWLWTPGSARDPRAEAGDSPDFPSVERRTKPQSSGESPEPARESRALPRISAALAFRLYDEQGFPLDLTELMARERGLTVDTAGFERLMDEQRGRARAAQKKTVIALSEIETKEPTHFLGYEHDHIGAAVQEVVALKDKTAVILNNSVCYAEMGGQVGDSGEMVGAGGNVWRIINTQKSGNTWLHYLGSARDSRAVSGDSPESSGPAHHSVAEKSGDLPDSARESRALPEEESPAVGDHVTMELNRPRRRAIERHHTVTHLLHWALHEVVSREAAQKGSFVGPDKLTFDFNSPALTPAQVREVEKLVNEKVVENAAVSWIEMPYAEVKTCPEIMQFFGDKYGDTVRVVQIGGSPRALNGYSMELCGGTHTRATGEIGLFRIVSEGAVAAGVRRIEAVAGLNAYDFASHDSERLKTLAAKLNTPVGDIEKKIESMLAQQKEIEKQLKAMQQRQAAETARTLSGRMQPVGSMPAIIENLGAASGDELQAVADALRQQQFNGVIVLAASVEGQVTLLAAVSPEFTNKVQAGKIIQTIAPIVSGKGGGRPDAARGAGKGASKIGEALAQAKAMLASAPHSPSS